MISSRRELIQVDLETGPGAASPAYGTDSRLAHTHDMRDVDFRDQLRSQSERFQRLCNGWDLGDLPSRP